MATTNVITDFATNSENAIQYSSTSKHITTIIILCRMLNIGLTTAKNYQLSVGNTEETSASKVSTNVTNT